MAAEVNSKVMPSPRWEIICLGFEGHKLTGRWQVRSLGFGREGYTQSL
jgi:hypothetical protein